MIATLYILEYHNKKHTSGLAHVVGVHNPPTGQQYLVVHSNTGSTIHVPSVTSGHGNVPIPGHGHTTGLDSPSPENSLSSVTTLEKSVGNRGKFLKSKKSSSDAHSSLFQTKINYQW